MKQLAAMTKLGHKSLRVLHVRQAQGCSVILSRKQRCWWCI